MTKKKIYGPDIYKRDANGLFENVDYKFNDDGSVDWRAMIKPEFLYANKDWFEARKMDIPTTTEDLQDNQLLVMLGGIKELAKLRGYTALDYDITNVTEDYVVAKCTINWCNNYESVSEFSTVYTDAANATLDNTDSFCSKFLETIACNRAFVRCVRNFLGVHIVGADEIDKSDGKAVKKSSSGDASHIFAITPTGTLQKTLAEVLNITNFDDFKEYLRTLWKNEAYKNEDIKDWNDFKDIPAKECRIIIALIRKTQK
jgi:hypothetical protein|tara:strand:+ start:7841 stop:8614 length:774 start_codon:yes stop_codon:yes gene_type:complete